MRLEIGNHATKHMSSNDSRLKNCYEIRQSALKWILITSFGYLGFSNSKFGRIGAHIAVCAFARDILPKASKIAEKQGFEIIHGIVDSIWIKSKRRRKREEEREKKKERNNQRIGFYTIM